MLSKKLLSAINRALAESPASRERLRAFVGRTARFEVAPFSFVFAVGADGLLNDSTAAGVEPDVRLVAPLAALPGLARGDERALHDVRIAGNAAFAQELFFVLRNLDLTLAGELESRFARVLPPGMAAAGASIAADGLRQGAAWGAESGRRLGQNLSEYLTHENPQIAHRTDLERFATQVDHLREGVDRLAKRIERLARSAATA